VQKTQHRTSNLILINPYAHKQKSTLLLQYSNPSAGLPQGRKSRKPVKKSRHISLIITNNKIMKKYFLGVVAIAVAIAFSAFTNPVKPTATQDFFFDELTFASTQGNVEDELKYIPSSPSCATGQRAACGVTTVDDKYYHNDNGTLKLNTHAYIISTNPLPEVGDLEMVIAAEPGSGSEYRILSVSSGSKINQQ
jgi:hypothetical protein